VFVKVCQTLLSLLSCVDWVFTVRRLVGVVNIARLESVESKRANLETVGGSGAKRANSETVGGSGAKRANSETVGGSGAKRANSETVGGSGAKRANSETVGGSYRVRKDMSDSPLSPLVCRLGVHRASVSGRC
jgi:hypothetical protein